MTILNLGAREKYKLNLEIPKPNQATLGTRSLRRYSPKKWNALPYHIKTSDNLNRFKSIIKSIALVESANIRLQDNRVPQNIILKYLILYKIQCEMKIL